MRKTTATFDALAGAQMLQDWIEAFRGATGVRLRLVIAGDQSATPKQSGLANTFGVGIRHSAILRAPIVIGGEHVATLISEPFCHPKARIRGQQRLLNLIAQHLSEFAARYATANGKHDPPCVTRAKEYIQAHAAQRISLREVAGHVHYSADHFRKRFTRFAGVPISRYLSRVRVEQSKELLSDLHKGIAEVAFACGFQSISSFNRRFKQCVDMSPTEYRRSLRKGQ